MSTATCTRGTTNGNARGSSYSRRRRREWLVETYRADQMILVAESPDDGELVIEGLAPGRPLGQAIADWTHLGWAVEVKRACRCYRCGKLLTVDTVTVDRIVPGCKGGTYRRNNIRPACGPCNSETGGALRGAR